jgi:hypothetical protein
MYIQKFYLQISEVPKIVQQLSGSGLELPFEKLEWQQLPFVSTQNSINISVNMPQYQNLERILITSRFTSDTNQVCTRDKNFFRNGSDIFLGGQRNSSTNTQTQTPTFNYSSGNLAYAVDGSSNVLTNPATAPSGGLLWASRNYNGLHKIQVKWMSEQLIKESDYLYMSPWNFKKIKNLTKECFTKQQQADCELHSYLYEGLDPNTYAWINENSQFVIGLPFTNVAGAELNGISLSKSACDIYLWTNTSNSAPNRMNDLTEDVYIIVQGVLRWNLEGVSATF